MDVQVAVKDRVALHVKTLVGGAVMEPVEVHVRNRVFSTAMVDVKMVVEAIAKAAVEEIVAAATIIDYKFKTINGTY